MAVTIPLLHTNAVAGSEQVGEPAPLHLSPGFGLQATSARIPHSVSTKDRK
jgi:hypothetical protein